MAWTNGTVKKKFGSEALIRTGLGINWRLNKLHNSCKCCLGAPSTEIVRPGTFYIDFVKRIVSEGNTKVA